jgi:hypothetical protein
LLKCEPVDFLLIEGGYLTFRTEKEQKSRMKTILSFFLALMVIISPVSGGENGAPATVQLISESELISPGDTFRLLISFELDPSWHLIGKIPAMQEWHLL